MKKRHSLRIMWKKLLAILFIAGVLLLFACSQPPVLSDAATATPSSTPKDPLANHKIDAWTVNPNEENDGKISLTISDVRGGCHPLGQPIQIRMTFHNLTDDTLIIPGIFKIYTNYLGVTDIIAALKPADKDELYAVMQSTVEVDILSRIPTPSAYYELPANDSLEKIVKYRLRQEIRVYDSQKDEYYFLPVDPGRYFLKFRYTLSHFDFLGNRKNRIGYAISNQIEICLKEYSNTK